MDRTQEKPILSSFKTEWSQILEKLILNPTPEIMKCFFTTGSNFSLFSSIQGLLKVLRSNDLGYLLKKVFKNQAFPHQCILLWRLKRPGRGLSVICTVIVAAWAQGNSLSRDYFLQLNL